MVDAGLAADRGVDLREQRGRNLHERHAALVDRGGEPGDVADDAASQRNDGGRPLRLLLEKPRQHVVQRIPALVDLAVGDEERLGRDSRAAKRVAQRREPRFCDRRIADDHHARRGEDRREQPPRLAQRPRADMDRIAARAKRDRERLHRRASAHDGAAASRSPSSSSAKRITRSRSDSMTLCATSRYSGSRCA